MTYTDSATQHRKLPAEWEPQDGILLAWPHQFSDWLPYLDEAEQVFVNIVQAVSRFQQILIAAWSPAQVEQTLCSAGVSLERVHIYQVESNDTWARDFGPLTILDQGTPVLLDMGFNGWGLKYPANLDNRITRRLRDAGAFGPTELRTCGLILEGGSIESDGEGTILTTSQCLTSPNRNPHLDRSGIEAALYDQLGADRVLWLEHGYLAGDDTDSHIDTLARLCPDDTIIHLSCHDASDEHHAEICAMVAELKELRTRAGNPYRLIALPWPEARFDDEGNRLPATHANFLVINGAVLVPTYRDAADQAALEAVARAYPGRQIIGIDCLPLIRQHGSLHCVTMQLPAGTLRQCLGRDSTCEPTAARRPHG